VAVVAFVAAAFAPMAGGAAIVAVYSVAAFHRGRWTSGAMSVVYVLYLVTGAFSLVVFRDEDLGVAGEVIAAGVLTIAAYGWGLAVRSRRELLAALRERADRAESDQRAQIEAARRAERDRIAAEMHDVLAHRLSLLSLHAGAIEFRPGASAAELAGAAKVVRSNAHLALEDLRTVIGVLRGGDIGLSPQPGFDDLGALVGECRMAGMVIDVDDELDRVAAVPDGVGRHVYQVVRETLTNARKHAPDQPVQVHLSGGPGDGLRVEVSNPVLASVPVGGEIPGAGVGLIGLRERADVSGGTLEHFLDGGDWRLRAWFPWPT
jgi:signal transduction histidine kinase